MAGTEPVAWAAGREAAFVDFIDFELREARTARIGLDKQHREWLSQYRVSAKPSTKSFPYEGASNETLPLTAIDVDQLYAGFMQTIHAPPNLWTMEALNERWINAAKPLQDFMQLVDTRVLKMYNVNKRAFLECTKLGTAIYKTGWKYERRKVWGYDAAGNRQQQSRIVSAPYVDHTRLADFILPAYSYAIQPDDQGGAPWVAERHRVSLGQLYAMAEAQAPFMPNIDKATLDLIKKFLEPSKTKLDVKLQELDFARRGEPSSPTALDGDAFDRDRETGTPGGGGAFQRPHEVELFEIHARFATRDTHSEDDIVVWYHVPTRKIVRAVYSRDDTRPYDKIVYFPGDGFFGIGVCEQKEMFQRLGSELFNFTMDNVLLVNSRMIVAKAGANISPGEPIYPNKVWLTDGNVRDEFGVFPMADIYASLPMISQSLSQLGEKRTGISDIQLGSLNSLPGRTPAQTMQALLQEGKRRPDLTIKDMRYEGLSSVGLRVLQNIQRYASSPMDIDGKRWLKIATDALGIPEGNEVASKLMTPLEPIELGVGVALTATSGSANKETEQQGALALLQLAGQVTPQFLELMQVAMQAQGTPLGDVALKSATALQELYKRTVEKFDVRNIDEVLPLVGIVDTAQAGGVPVAAGPNGAGSASLASPPSVPALENLSPSTGALG